MKEIELNVSFNRGIIPSLINDLNIWIRKYNEMTDRHHIELMSTLDTDPLTIVEHVRELKPITYEIKFRVDRLRTEIKFNEPSILDDLNHIEDEIVICNNDYKILTGGVKINETKKI